MHHSRNHVHRILVRFGSSIRSLAGFIVPGRGFRISFRPIGLLLFSLTALAFYPLDVTRAARLTATQWNQDIDMVRDRIESLHPNPWTRVPQQEWLKDLSAIRNDAGRVPDAETATRLLQLVARLGDTHTNLWPSAIVGFDQWFPLKIYEFNEGYFLTAIDRRQGDFVASKVVAVNGIPIADAAAMARSLRSSENEFGRREATYYLSSPPALRTLGLIQDETRVTFDLVARDGQRHQLEIEALRGEASMGWTRWGEMFGPSFQDPRQLTTAFGTLAPMEYRTRDDTRPLHLRYRGRYAYWHLNEEDAIYAQINFLLDSDDHPFETGFMRELFEAVDRTGVEKLVLDLRYNGGGDGSMAIPFVHELIKRDDSINQPGRLFILVGRKTFSAAVGLLDQIVVHTSALLVGEPPRSPFNHFGDPTSITLPNSGMQLDVSNRYWQLSTSDDLSRTIPIHYPAPFTSTEYFSGEDPALNAIFSGRVQSIPKLIRDRGGQAALELVRLIRSQSGQPDWWIPFDERTMRHAGEELIHEGRIDDGLAACRLNTEFFGKSWRVWESLGDGLEAAGDPAGALTAFRRALELKPDNWNATHQLERITALSDERIEERVSANHPSSSRIGADPFRPEVIRFGAKTSELQPVLKPLCTEGLKIRPIEPPFLPDVKDAQLQIDCDGFDFMGAPRWAEFVIGDGELKMVWIMVEPEDQQAIVEALTEAYGLSSHRNSDFIAFTQGRAAWRFQPAEVLFYSEELSEWVLRWFE